jgi:hypothetical protein
MLKGLPTSTHFRKSPWEQLVNASAC